MWLFVRIILKLKLNIGSHKSWLQNSDDDHFHSNRRDKKCNFIDASSQFDTYELKMQQHRFFFKTCR